MHFSARVFSLVLATGTVLAATTVPVVWQTATAQEQRDPDVRTKRTPTMRENVYRQIDRAREAAEAGRFNEALKDLNGLADSNLNSYEAAMTYNLMAYAHYAREDYPAAVRAYQNVLKQDALPDSLLKNSLFSMAQIMIVSERYKEGIDALERWFRLEENPNASAYILLGQAYFQEKQYDKARKPIETAIARARAEGTEVRENWWLLLRAIHYTAGNYNQLRDVLQELVAGWPKAEYWTQLSAVYGELKQPKKQLATMESAYDQGLLSSGSDYRTLAQLLLGGEVPYKAAKVLNEAFEKNLLERDQTNLRTLADAWTLAKEYDRAAEILEQAAAKSGDGTLYLRLAQLQSERANWNSALDAARKALGRGGLDRPDQARIVEGLSLYNLDRLEEAKTAFSRAARFESSQAVARQWQTYIEREQNRLAALERARRASEEQTEKLEQAG